MKLARRLVRWFRVVSPPAWAVVLALFVQLSFEALYRFTLGLNDDEVARTLGQASDATVVGLTFAYALFRGLAFHPALQADYLAWLALTPWRSPKPLPLGPVHVLAQDLVVLCLLEVLLLDAPFGFRPLLPAIFFFVLAGCWAVFVWSTGPRSAAYEVGYALGAALWVASFSYVGGGACLVVTWFLALHRFLQSFAMFPWETFRARRQRERERRSRPHKGQGLTSEHTTWGWAFDVLSPQQIEELPRVDRLMLSGLAGWSAFAVLSHSQPKVFEPATLVAMISLCAGAMYCVRQVFRHIWSHLPPIGLVGRLFTGRLLIPSYDVALLPVVYFFGTAGIARFLLDKNLAWSPQYVLPAALTVFLLLMNLACPDLERWRLTCQARLSAWSYAGTKSEFEQL